MRSLFSNNSNVSASPLPAWLAKVQTLPQHRRAVLELLSSREATRALARDLSRPRGRVPSELRGTAQHCAITQDMVDHYSVAHGSHPEHERKNRYYQLEAYDRTRVVVKDADSESTDSNGDVCGRYLNANWVQERYGRRWWIANQAPLPHTAHAFLSVVLQPTAVPPESLRSHDQTQLTPCRVRTVVQLTQNTEGGRTKAHPYFPNQVGQSIVLTPEGNCDALPLKSTLLETKHHPDALCIESIVSVMPVARHRNAAAASSDEHDEVEPVLFRHMLYYAWPDFGVPSSEDRSSLLNFVRLVHMVNTTPVSVGEQQPNDSLDPPIMVGCSAGIGRTGTFITLSSMLRTFNLLSPSSLSDQHPETASQPARPAFSVLSSFLHRRSGSRSSIDSIKMPSRSPLGPIPDQFSDDLVLQEIDSLRDQRPFMVQQDQQAILVYDMLASELSAKGSSVGRE